MISITRLRHYIAENRKSNFLFYSALISLSLLTLLVIYSSPEILLSMLYGLKPEWLFLLFVIFLLLLTVVTLRLVFALNLSVTTNFYRCFDISVFHIILLTILPARLGDVCYPFILRQNLSLDIAQAISNLFLLRVYDLIIASSLLLLATSVISLDIQTGHQIYLAVLSLIILIFILISTGNYTLSRVIRRVEKRHLRTGHWLELLKQVRSALSAHGVREHIIILAMTCLRWLLACLLFLFIFKALQIEINLFQAILITTGINLAVLIPVQTMGGFGITEAVLAWFLGIFGYPLEMAITIALASRLVWLIFPFLIGMVWITIRKKFI